MWRGRFGAQSELLGLSKREKGGGNKASPCSPSIFICFGLCAGPAVGAFRYRIFHVELNSYYIAGFEVAFIHESLVKP